MTEQNPESISFRPAVTKRASEVIFDQIKEMIFRRQLKPGDRLPSERSMMEMFQRSRPTIREALRMLERGGYIKTIAGSNGAVVLEPDNHSIRQSIEDAINIGQVTLAEMSEYRLISETATVVWACRRRTDEDIALLRAQLDKMEGSIGNFNAYIAMDPEYHGLIAAAGKNAVSTIMNRTLSGINQSFMRGKISGLSGDEQHRMLCGVQKAHEAIFRAVCDRDEAAAREAMEKHLTSFLDDLR